MSGKSFIHLAEGLGDPKITFLALGAVWQLVLALNTNLWDFNGFL